MHRRELVEAMNPPRTLHAVRITLTELRHEGRVEPVGRGVWRLRVHDVSARQA